MKDIIIMITLTKNCQIEDFLEIASAAMLSDVKINSKSKKRFNGCIKHNCAEMG